MRRGVRIAVALGLGFVAYRIAVALMPTGPGVAVSVALGLIVGGCTWALTAPKAAR